jgi:hypothetical protein
MIEKAKDEFRSTLQNNPLYVQHVREKLALGKVTGLQYAGAKADRVSSNSGWLGWCNRYAPV